MADTKIDWADKVWNPIAGCTKCSPGCKNCYAERMAWRLARMYRKYPVDTQLKKYHNVMRSGSARWNNKLYCDYSILDKPLHWRKPKRIFVCSMSDLFHEKVPFEFIDDIYETIENCPQHTFIILTKRAKRALEFYTIANKFHRIPKNIHFCATICNQKEANEIIPILLRIPQAVRGLIIEPMLGPIDTKEYLDDGGLAYRILSKHYGKDGFDPKGEQHAQQKTIIDWVVVGCESGPGRRPCNYEWAQSIVNQCDAANVPVFVKQMNINGKVIKMPKEFPQELPERK